MLVLNITHKYTGKFVSYGNGSIDTVHRRQVILNLIVSYVEMGGVPPELFGPCSHRAPFQSGPRLQRALAGPYPRLLIFKLLTK